MKLRELSLIEKMTINGGWYGPFNPAGTHANYFSAPTFIHPFIADSSSAATPNSSIPSAPAMAAPVASLFSAPTVAPPSISTTVSSALTRMFSSVFG